ncbi:hypothetical protein DCAR_0207156 [Daucus carota subsp. sativus]|uniref:Defensin-like protein n=1 Tax=Daucus carota subsp. sativus TaxID=79200 RepID=A0AAF0WGV2_DAUCS|nr:hypothetical protein DCAR_0207156 [Daucus carota subsp. sativus]
MTKLLSITFLSILLIIFQYSLSSTATTVITPEQKRDIKCMSYLGPCDNSCDVDCCKRTCNNDYNSLHPNGMCMKLRQYPDLICVCTHDCQMS